MSKKQVTADKKNYIKWIRTVMEDQMDGYYECNDDGKVVEVSEEFVFWLNGLCLGWEIMTDANTKEDKIGHSDIIPEYKQAYDSTRVFYARPGSILYKLKHEETLEEQNETDGEMI